MFGQRAPPGFHLCPGSLFRRACGLLFPSSLIWSFVWTLLEERRKTPARFSSFPNSYLSIARALACCQAREIMLR